MSAHTPGPWVVGDVVRSTNRAVYVQILPTRGNRSRLASVSVYQYDGKGEAVGPMKPEFKGDRPRVQPTVPETTMVANARLIAAAPDLLAACEAAFRLLGALAKIVRERPDFPESAWPAIEAVEDTLTAAVTKAKGGAA